MPRKGAEREKMGGGDNGPVRDQSPVGRRHSAAAMSRRDKSSVENGVDAGCPEPLQGLDGVYLRVSRVSARMETSFHFSKGSTKVRILSFVAILI